MNRPTYLVAYTYPVYCPHTDGLIGSNTRTVDCARTPRHAQLIARRLSVAAEQWGDDGSYYAREADTGRRIGHFLTVSEAQARNRADADLMAVVF